MTVRWLAIVHHLPDRTRLRSPVLQRDPARCEQLADGLAAVSGVREIRVRPYTGSALISHAPRLALPMLVEESRRILECTRVLEPNELPPRDEEIPAFSSLARKLVAAVREIDRDIRRGSGGSVDLGTLATLGFFGAGTLEVATTGKLPMPPWFNLAWWGLRTFMTTEAAEIHAADARDPASEDG